MLKNLKRKFAKLALVAMTLQLVVMGLGTGATGMYAAADTTPPTANVVHNETDKTIVYTFDEPVKLVNNDGTDITGTISEKLAIYEIVGGNYELSTKTDNAILSADLVTGLTNTITIVYDGSLVQQTTKMYVVDAWGYKITDLANNKLELNPDLQVFTVNGDSIAPTAIVSHDETTKTINYTFSEPIQLRNNDESLATLTTDKLGIYGVTSGNYNLSTKTTNNIVSATLNTDANSIAIVYDGSLVKNVNTEYVVDAWGYRITDVAGNKMLPALTQIFSVAGDVTAPVITMTSIPSVVNDVTKSLQVTFMGNEAILLKAATNVEFKQGAKEYSATPLVQIDSTKLVVNIPANTFDVGVAPIDVAAIFTDLVLNETVFAGQITVDTLAPSAVSGLTTFVNDVGHVKLSWANPTIGTYTTLRIVRDGIITIVLDPTDTTFLDMTTVFGGTYKYVVIVGDDAGNETSTPQVTVSVAAPVVAAAVSDSTDYTVPVDEGTVQEEVKAETTTDEDSTSDGEDGFPVWGIILLLILAAVGGYLIWNQKPAPVAAPVETKKKNTSNKKK